MNTFFTKHLLGVLLGLLCLNLSAQTLHTTPGCPGTNPSVLRFTETPSGNNLVDWAPNGSLTQTYSNIDELGTQFIFTFSGNTVSFANIPMAGGGGSPAVTDFFAPGIESLGLYSRGIGDSIVMDIDISPAISGEIAFDIFHINQSGFSGDNLLLTARTTTGGTINPTYTTSATPDFVITGSGQVDANNYTTGLNSQLGVNFFSNDSIDRITMVWTDCSICGQQVHGIALGDIEFCSPFYDNDMDGIPDQVDLDDDDDGIPDAMELCNNEPVNPDMDTIDISILLDGYPEETSWRFETPAGQVLASGGPYVSPTDIGRIINTQVFVPSDQATVFQIIDSYGDALTSSPTGSYTISQNGTVIAGPVTTNWQSSDKINIAPLGAPYNSFDCIGTDYAFDSDGDGIRNFEDPDFCTLNALGVCDNLDSDGDGVIDPFDLDADNDGIPDLVEAGGVDTNGDGFVDDLTDLDEDGLSDVYDKEIGGNSIVFFDTDNDGIPDALDLDSDNDGILDVVEAGGDDSNFDGMQDGADSDGDGLADDVDGDVGNDGTAENTAGSLVVTGNDTNGDGNPESYSGGDFDGDGLPNFIDLDADNDGIPDVIEAQGNACYVPPSSVVDGKGVPVNFVNYTNCADNSTATTYGAIPNEDADDTDGMPDFLDLDSDADANYDFNEGINQNADGNAADEYLAMGSSFTPIGGSSAVYNNSIDTDADGIPDWMDNQPSTSGTNVSQLPPFQDPSSSFYFDTDNDGIVDLLDPHNGGTPVSFPFDIDNDADPDWRDQGDALPIELVSFGADWLEGAHGQIRWETETERRTSHYNLFRSLNGTDFAPITEVAGAGTTMETQYYQFIDYGVIDQPAEIVYYQLEEVDLDGNTWRSQIEVLLMPENGGLSWEVYPNPFQDQIKIELYGESNSLEIGLYDAALHQVWSETRTLAGEMTLEKELSQLAKGFYLLKIRYNGQEYSRKLIKN